MPDVADCRGLSARRGKKAKHALYINGLYGVENGVFCIDILNPLPTYSVPANC